MDTTRTRVFRVRQEGSLEELDGVSETYFSSISGLLIYLPKTRRLYAWAGKHVDSRVREHLARVKATFTAKFPGLKVKKLVMVTSGEEPADFFEALGLSREKFLSYARESQDWGHLIKTQLDVLEVSQRVALEREDFWRVVDTANEIIFRATKLRDYALVERQRELIREMLGKQRRYSEVEAKKDSLGQLAPQLAKLLSEESHVAAHQTATDIKTVVNLFLGGEIPPEVEALLAQERTVWSGLVAAESELKDRIAATLKDLDARYEEGDYEAFAERFEILERDISRVLDPETKVELERELEVKRARLDELGVQYEERVEKEIQDWVEELRGQFEEALAEERLEDAADVLATIRANLEQSIDEEFVAAWTVNVDDLELLLGSPAGGSAEAVASGALERAREETLELIGEADRKSSERAYDEALASIKRAVAIAGESGLDDEGRLAEEKHREVVRSKELSERVDRLAVLVSEYREKELLEPALENCRTLTKLAPQLGLDDTENQYGALAGEIEELLAREREAQQRERERLLREAGEVEKILGANEGVLPLVEDIPIDDLLPGVAGDVDVMFERLEGILEEHRVEVSHEATTTSTLRSASGEVVQLERKVTIAPAAAPAGAEGRGVGGATSGGAPAPPRMPQPALFHMESALENPFGDDYLEEAVVADLIPYNFEITELLVDGEEPETPPEKTLKKDGLEVAWTLRDVPPAQKVEFQYEFRERVSRTVVLTLPSAVRIIKTHANLNRSELDGLFDALMEFTNSLKERLPNVVIEDIIPLSYLYSIRIPEEEPRATSETPTGSLVKWGLEGVPRSFHATHQYKLLELSQFEELKIQARIAGRRSLEALDGSDPAGAAATFREFVEGFEASVSELGYRTFRESPPGAGGSGAPPDPSALLDEVLGVRTMGELAAAVEELALFFGQEVASGQEGKGGDGAHAPDGEVEGRPSVAEKLNARMARLDEEFQIAFADGEFERCLEMLTQLVDLAGKVGDTTKVEAYRQLKGEIESSREEREKLERVEREKIAKISSLKQAAFKLESRWKFQEARKKYEEVERIASEINDILTKEFCKRKFEQLDAWEREIADFDLHQFDVQPFKLLNRKRYDFDSVFPTREAAQGWVDELVSGGLPEEDVQVVKLQRSKFKGRGPFNEEGLCFSVYFRK
ncbi:MAG: hypothetical protein ACTSU5_08995 [Promethearchaeota archaeon]